MTATAARPHTYTRRTSAERLGTHGVQVRGEGARPPLLVERDGDAEWTSLDLLLSSIESAIAFTFSILVEKRQLTVDAYYSETEATVEMEDGAWRIARLVVKPSIVLRDPATETRVLKLVNVAVRECMIADTLSTSVIVEPKIVG
jgi:organic hydroperoxide reductase OsmC/OhrA